LRVPPAAGKGSRVSLSFPDRKKPVEVEVESCDRGVCLATVPVGPILRDNIAREATVGVSYGTGDGTISINLPLKGLNPALEAIE
ncbi:invasion associated locus B family protein, partial [Sinorhizobium meliloti]